ncbi:hypothetical protein BDB01DRAFT_791440 [Pilobolus umbonatus]|nr:hypothetical protein BDB01DRAFT_791440 [Pilobolus umbonatus]
MNSLHVIDGKRILCVADIRGYLSEFNRLAREFNAQYIIHTGDFGFYDKSSLHRIGERPLKHWIQYTTLLTPTARSGYLNGSHDELYDALENSFNTMISEMPDFLAGEKQLDVPVYTVWGFCEDVAIIEKFRTKEYRIDNLFILDEASTYALDIGGVNLRLFGLGGAVVQHRLFDNGEGTDTIAGGLGVMWTTTLQIGELVELAESVYDPSETRVLVTHASPGREGLLAQLALTLHADITLSAGLHFRYNIAYNEYACQYEIDHFRNRLIHSQQQFMQLWDDIKDQVEESVDEHQHALLQNALNVVNRIPPSTKELESGKYENPNWKRDELSYKNMWHFNLPDTSYGSLVFHIAQGLISSEMKSYGLNFSYRRNQTQTPSPAPSSVNSATVLEKPNQYRNSSAEWQQQQELQLQQPQQQAPPSQPTQQLQPQQLQPQQLQPQQQMQLQMQQQQQMQQMQQMQHEVENNSYMNNNNYNGYNNYNNNNNNRNSKRQSVRVPNTAYVGGLSNTTVTEDDIREYFGYENVTSVKFPIDQSSQLPKAHCYVEFVSQAALEQALMKHGQTFRDNKLVVNRPISNQSGDNGRGRGRGRGSRGYRDSRMYNDH